MSTCTGALQCHLRSGPWSQGAHKCLETYSSHLNTIQFFWLYMVYKTTNLTNLYPTAKSTRSYSWIPPPPLPLRTSSLSRLQDHTQTNHTWYDSSGQVIGRRRELYLTTHTHTRRRQTSIPLAGLEPAMPRLRTRDHRDPFPALQIKNLTNQFL